MLLSSTRKIKSLRCNTYEINKYSNFNFLSKCNKSKLGNIEYLETLSINENKFFMSTFYIQWSENLTLEKIKIIKEISEKNVIGVESKRNKDRSYLEKRYIMPLQATVFSHRIESQKCGTYI